MAPVINILPREKQIEVIAALCDGLGMRAVSRITGTDRKTVARLALKVGRGCAELHDRMMVGLRVSRCELDELWAYVAKKQARVKKTELGAAAVGDQYTFIALASSSRAIITYLTGKRDSGNTHAFIADLRERVIGSPEISTDGFLPYQNTIRAEFGNRIAHGVTHLAVKEAARRYSPAQVFAVERDVVSGVPSQISTSYAERQNLTLRMSSKRFSRLSKRLLKEAGAALRRRVALRRALQSVPRSRKPAQHAGHAFGIADLVWTIGDLIDAALAIQPIDPVVTAPERRKRLRVIDGGRN